MTVSFGSGVSLQLPIDEIKINLDNSGNVLTTGAGTSYYQSSSSGRIMGWEITGFPTGSIVVDIWKAPNGIPTGANSIVGSEPPTLVNAQLSNDLSLDTWNRKIEALDVFAVNIVSVSLLQTCVITLKVLKG